MDISVLIASSIDVARMTLGWAGYTVISTPYPNGLAYFNQTTKHLIVVKFDTRKLITSACEFYVTRQNKYNSINQAKDFLHG